MRFLANKLAEHEMAVAHYYMKRGAYLAAVNRCQYVLEHYPTSPETKNALKVMAEAYENWVWKMRKSKPCGCLLKIFPMIKKNPRTNNAIHGGVIFKNEVIGHGIPPILTKAPLGEADA